MVSMVVPIATAMVASMVMSMVAAAVVSMEVSVVVSKFVEWDDFINTGWILRRMLKFFIGPEHYGLGNICETG